MKIALVLDRFDRDLGGLERATSQFACSLVEHGHEVHVVARAFAEPSLTPGITPHRIEASPLRLERAAAAERCLRSLDVDIIHDTGVGWYFDVLQPHGGSCIADWRQNLRSEPWYRRPLFAMSPARRRGYQARRQVERRQLGSRRGVIIAVSRMVASHLREIHGIDPNRIRIVYNGVDVEHFTPARRTTDRPATRAQLGLGDEVLFLLTAHNLQLKGAAAALAALARLATHAPPACLALMGRGETRTYERQARALGIAERCRFLGFISDPAPYYSAADVYLHPTFYDPCSLAVLEAWASGLPVITTRFNGAAELMTPGLQGLLLRDPRDIGALAAAMRQMLDPGARAIMADPARALALANSTAVNFQNIMAVYGSIISGGARSA
jgi:UDP-glucose:(heptosyl)LPS alpha-1,3-glucosyltransferase